MSSSTWDELGTSLGQTWDIHSAEDAELREFCDSCDKGKMNMRTVGFNRVLFDHRTVGGDNLPHAAQMIRQKIARFHSARRGHYAPATETRTLEYSVIIYQRTCITNGFVVVVSTHLNLRPVER